MYRRQIICAKTRKEVLAKTHCANHPYNFAPGCKGYICPLWKSGSGEFDESGKQIDHIVEVKHGGTNDLSNLQALCPCCHAVKTRRCAQQSWEFTSPEIDSGRANMNIDAPAKKRQRPTSSV